MGIENLGIKYRPQNFNELIGQEHIVKTLTNAIVSKKTAQSYLFSGPRGTGKTSTARILAKSLNCENGPTPEPCNTCNYCMAINNGSSLDVQEIDGASNNSVDDIRQLRENVKYSPNSRYKIYIIDEVHMLSKGAFNALLKTLEEPPENVVFIFATTEPTKIPATIISRCQRLDFNLISTKVIFNHLKKICKNENISYDDAGLFEISRAGRGSVRDALSILSQVATFCNNNIQMTEVQQILNIIGHSLAFELIEAILNHDTSKSITLFETAYKKGYDVSGFCLDIISHFRNLLIVHTVKNPQFIIDEADEYIQKMSSISKKITSGVVFNIIDNLNTALSAISRSNIPRILFESALVKITQPTKILQTSKILEKIDNIEQLLSSLKMSEKKQIPTAAIPEKKILTLSDIKSVFNTKLIPYFKEKNAMVSNALETIEFKIFKNNSNLTISAEQKSYDILIRDKIRGTIENKLYEFLKTRIKIRILVLEKKSELEMPTETTDPEIIEKLVEQNELVKNVINIFGGRIEKVSLLK